MKTQAEEFIRKAWKTKQKMFKNHKMVNKDKTSPEEYENKMKKQQSCRSDDGLREEGKRQAIEEVEKIINKYWNKAMPPDYKFEEILKQIKKMYHDIPQGTQIKQEMK